MKIKHALLALVVITLVVMFWTIIRGVRNQGQDIQRVISGIRQAEVLKGQESSTGTVEGSLHGTILSRSGYISGEYQENQYILSIRFMSGTHTHLLDVPLRQAEVVHFQGRTTVRVFVECHSTDQIFYDQDCYVLRFYLLPTGRPIGQELISKELFLSIYRSMKRQQNRIELPEQTSHAADCPTRDANQAD